MKAMASGFDRHGYYATGHERAQLERMRERGLGLGVVLAPIRHGDRTQVEIVRVRPGSRAEDAGLGEGDQVLEIGDQTTVDLRRGIDIERRLAELADRRGSPTVPMTVRPRGRLQPNRVQLPWTRTLPEASVQGRLLEASGRTVFWLHINEFVRGTGHAFEGELERLRVTAGTHQPLGLVLDLRGNPGGNIDEALIVADAFLSSGVITTTRGREGRILREERAHRVTAEPDLAMVVLQDEYTASAAELLAMALRDHKRAALVGTRTFGKGTVQELRGLADGGLLALTIARYHGPAGEMIDGVGVAPDAAVHVHSSMAHRPGIGRFPRALPRSGEAVEGWKSDITLFRGIQMLMPGQGIDRK